MDKENTVVEVLNTLNNIHFPSGLTYKYYNKTKALCCSEENEIERIYYLVESLTPTLRFKSILRYDRATENDDYNKNGLPLNKDNIKFTCNSTNLYDRINELIQKIEKLPKEWTLIQISSKFDVNERLDTSFNLARTNPLDITVFDCGQSQRKPFCVTVNVPKDKVKKEPIEICEEMYSIVKDIKEGTGNFFKKFGTGRFKSAIVSKDYYEIRSELDNRLKEVVEVVQNQWLGVWRCLLIGKYIETKREEEITKIIQTLSEEFSVSFTEKISSILRYVIKGTSHLSLNELRDAVKFLFPDKERLFYTKMVKRIKELVENHYVGAFNSQKRHPVILIIEENLDLFPWEMMDIIEDHPVCRMPSFHFTYGLFKEHKDTIVDGFKTSIKPETGTYVINPGLDLKKMEIRLRNYFEYWTPQWNRGVVGRAPSSTEFEQLLTSSDIFIYSGHGNGCQYLPGDKIQRLRVNGVVFLFGCSSVKLQVLGPQVEMYGSYHMYLIACSPCVVGALWEVTDIDTDILSTEFLSLWIPSAAKHHWKEINHKKWEKGEAVVPIEQKKSAKNFYTKHEPELLRALSLSRKAARYFTTKASFVARGLPVRLNI